MPTTPTGRAPPRALPRSGEARPQPAPPRPAAPPRADGFRDGARAAGQPELAPALKPDLALQQHTERSWLLANGSATQVGLRTLELIERPAEPRLREVSEGELEARTLVQAGVRAAQLAARQPRPVARITPEDGSVRVRAFHLAAFRDGGQEYAWALARIGQREGFSVVLRVPAEHVDALGVELQRRKLDNVKLQPISGATLHGPDRLDAWSEDQGELHLDGTVSVLPRLERDDAVRAEVLREREARLRDRLVPGAAPDRFAVVGAVSARRAERALAALAVGRGGELRTATTYLEGGNTLAGTLPSGQGYVVIGKDSLVASRALLEHELGRPVTLAELRSRVAEDCGVTPGCVFEVEQPGDFHLDMKMMLLPGGHAVVNDAVEAAALQAGWLRDDHQRGRPADPAALPQWEQVGRKLEAALAGEAARAEAAARVEALTAEDLEAAGLVVHRMAGVFAPVAGRGAMNFLNGEAALNAKGERFYVALGGDARAEQHVIARLDALPGRFSRVHFISKSLSADTLSHFGGLSCRTKLEALR